MGFIKDFFLKEEQINVEDLNIFIQQKPQENQHLEFKGKRVLGQKESLIESVTAMLNADGGLVVVGIKEERLEEHGPSFAKEIEWITGKDLSPERLESILLSNIDPRPQGIKIVPVVGDEGGIFLIEINPSLTPPHQAADGKYYQRYNFQNLPMKHFQVADCFGKRKKPNLELVARVPYDWRDDGYCLEFRILNKSYVTAHNVGLIVHCPPGIEVNENKTDFEIFPGINHNLQRFSILRAKLGTILPEFYTVNG